MILLALFGVCGFGVALLYCLPQNLNKTYQVIGLTFVFIIACGGCSLYNVEIGGFAFQFLQISSTPWLSYLKLNVSFGLDGISFLFLVLTIIIFPFCILASWKMRNKKFLFMNLLAIELFLILTFTSLDLFFFCLFFESLLIPMFFIILVWGSRDRRIKALTYFVLYTLFGSIFLLTALFLLFSETRSTAFSSLLCANLDWTKQKIFWILLFISFSIKIPMFPFHIWLPEAHVEAPTVGSVILAGLLLKLGAYGMLRFLFIFDICKRVFQPYVFTMCLISVFMASFIAIRQLDMKRIIAYSSIAHMNFALLGFFSNNIYGLTGGTFLMVSHGIVSSALFLLIGVLYDRYHTRSILYYGGLVTVMPLFATIFFLFTISNFSFPGTSNFVGELLVLFGLAVSPNKLVLLTSAASTFFGLVYSLLLFNRIVFGNLKYLAIQKFVDLDRREFAMLFILALVNLFLGLVPNYLLVVISGSMYSLVNFAMDVTAWEPYDNGQAARSVGFNAAHQILAFYSSDMDVLIGRFWEEGMHAYEGQEITLEQYLSLERGVASFNRTLLSIAYDSLDTVNTAITADGL